MELDPPIATQDVQGRIPMPLEVLIVLARHEREIAGGGDFMAFPFRWKPRRARNACSRFICVKNLVEAEPAAKEGGGTRARTSVPKKGAPSRVRKFIAGAIGEPDADGWENFGSVGQLIQNAHPDFDLRSCGCANWNTLV